MHDNLLKKWREDHSFVSLQRSPGKAGAQLVTGLDGSQRSFFIAALSNSTSQAGLVLTSDMARAERLYEEIKAFLPEHEVYLFPGKDFFYTDEVLTQSKEILQQRLKVLERLVLGQRLLVVAPLPALFSKLTPANLWKKKQLEIKIGVSVNWEAFFKSLVEMGYERAELTESEGSFSVRGDIVDIFPFYTPLPLRISFLDEEVESIRYFDAESQRSLETIPAITILPAREVILNATSFQEGAKALAAEAEQVTRQLKIKNQEKAADRLRTKVENHLVKLRNFGYFDGIEQYISYFYAKPSTLIDYFPQGGLLFWDEPESVVSAGDSLLKELQDYQTELLLQGDILPGQVQIYWTLKDILQKNTLKLLR